MQKILVHDATHQRTVIPREGKPSLVKYTQKMWIFLQDDPHPTQFKHTAWPDRITGEEPQPYPAGEYIAMPQATSVNRWDDLQFRLELKEAKVSSTKAA